MDPQQDSNYLERLAALQLLRENIFFNNPTRYAFTDVAEDLPGPLRNIAPNVKDVLPSLSIISRDAEERKAQIQKALDRIKNTGEAKTSLGKEVLHNVRDMGLGSLAPGFLLASAFNLMGFRSPIKNTPTGKVFRSPTTFSKNFKKLFNTPGYAKELASESGKEALIGAGLAAGSAAAYPILARGAQISNKAFSEASKIMQDQPYATSTPGAEMLSVMREDPSDSSSPVVKKLKNVGLSTVLGTGAGALAAAAPTGIKTVGMGLSNLLSKKPILSGIVNQLRKDLPSSMGTGALFGGGLGMLGGLLAKRLSANENS
jgi:hypothetical protein